METEDHNTPTWKTILKLAGLVMAFLYLFMGVFLIAYGSEIFTIEAQYRVLLGVILIAYGAFRCYRIYHQHRSEENP